MKSCNKDIVKIVVLVLFMQCTFTANAAQLEFKDGFDRHVMNQARLFATENTCFFHDREKVSALATVGAKLLEAVAAPLISMGIDRLNKHLQDAAEDKSVTTTAFVNTRFGPNNIPACIQFIKGKFTTQDDWKSVALSDPGVDLPYEEPILQEEAILENTDPDYNPLGVKDVAQAAVRLNEIGAYLVDEPDVFAEFVIALPTGSKPSSHVHYGNSALIFEESSTSKKDYKERDLVFTLTFSKPSRSGGGDLQSSVGKISIEEIKPGKRYIADPGMNTTEWMVLNVAAGEIEDWMVNVSMTETEEAGEFVKFLAGLFESSKDDLEKIAKETLLPSKQLEQRKAQDEAMISKLTAIKEANAAIKMFENNTDEEKAKALAIDARVAMLKANPYCRAVDGEDCYKRKDYQEVFELAD